MYAQQGPSSERRPAAVELHGLDSSSCSLLQLRQLCGQAGPVLQLIAALEGGDASQGLALVIYADQRSAAAAVDLLDGCPLGGAFLRAQRADNLPNSLINLLYSLEQSSAAQAQADATARTNAYLREQQQYLQDHRRREQVQAAAAGAQEQARAQAASWDAQVRRTQAEADDAQRRRDDVNWAGSPVQGGQQQQQQQGWAQADDQAQSGGLLANGQACNGGLSSGGSSASGGGVTASTLAAQQRQLAQQQRQLAQQQQQLETDLRHLQLDTWQKEQAQAQQGRGWAAAAATPPSLGRQQNGGPTVAAQLAATALGSAGNGSSVNSEEWQAAGGGRGRAGARVAEASDQHHSGSGGRGNDSSVSSGSPRPTNRSSDDRAARMVGQDGASPDPTTKLWMGGIDGNASAETVRQVFGRFGPIYDYELQQATHEKGRTDQWGFVNYKKLADASRAYEQLVGEVIPELTGTRKLKLQFRTVDGRRLNNGRR